MREIDKVYNFSLFFFFIVSHRLILMEEGDLKYATINLYLLISGISGISGIKPHLKLTTQVAMKVQRQFAGKLFQTFVRRAKKKKKKKKKPHIIIYIYIYIYMYFTLLPRH